MSSLPGKGKILVQVHLGVHQKSQVFFCQALSQRGGSLHVLMHGIFPPEVQDFALCFELHEVPVSPFVHPVKVIVFGSAPLVNQLQIRVLCHQQISQRNILPYHPRY